VDGWRLPPDMEDSDIEKAVTEHSPVLGSGLSVYSFLL
jgi:hypothetical protein